MDIKAGEIMDKSKKLLQINTCNFGSTGSIMLNIDKKAKEAGFTTYIAYPYSEQSSKKIIDNSIIIGTAREWNIHLKLAYYSGYNGCFSWLGTYRFIKKVDSIKPDIIHLHNLHNCYINLGMLFNYIKRNNIPVVWTLHDCWAFTGQCPHFSMIKCDKWKMGCFNCPQYGEYPASRVDKTKKMYRLKKAWFTGVKNLTVVTPSHWLAELVKESFLGCYPVKVINNGINLKVYKPTQSNFRKNNNLEDKIILLGVASVWNKKKGLDIFIELAELIPEEYKIVLVGLTEEQLKALPQNILGIKGMDNPTEIAAIYTAADYFVNPSVEEAMGLVTVEALACGTPVIVSNCTAVPEAVNQKCGTVVEDYSARNFYNAIINSSKTYLSKDCIDRAKEYDMCKKYREYLDLYRDVLR